MKAVGLSSLFEIVASGLMQSRKRGISESKYSGSFSGIREAKKREISGEKKMRNPAEAQHSIKATNSNISFSIFQNVLTKIQ